jgi:ribonuclease P protein component
MLSKTNRLTKKKDFETVFRFGRSIFTKHIGIKYQKSNLPQPRFGIIVSNKIAKKANKRNKLKRQLREIIRLRIKSGQVNFPYDFIIIARPGILDLDYQGLEKELLASLTKKNG